MLHHKAKAILIKTPIIAICAVIIAVIMVGSAYAQISNEVVMRVSSKDAHDRIVLITPVPYNYELKEKEPGALQMIMNRSGVFNLASFRQNPTAYVWDVDIASSLNENLMLDIKIPTTSRYRSFKIGTRIIIDVFKPTD